MKYIEINAQQSTEQTRINKQTTDVTVQLMLKWNKEKHNDYEKYNDQYYDCAQLTFTYGERVCASEKTVDQQHTH